MGVVTPPPMLRPPLPWHCAVMQAMTLGWGRLTVGVICRPGEPICGALGPVATPATVMRLALQPPPRQPGRPGRPPGMVSAPSTDPPVEPSTVPPGPVTVAPPLPPAPPAATADGGETATRAPAPSIATPKVR